MKAIVFTGKNEVAYTELPDPKPGADEVVVEIKASGICHTDYEVLKDNYGTGAFPVVPGHEYAGVVVDVGPDVTNVRPVTELPSIQTLNVASAAPVGGVGPIFAKILAHMVSPRMVALRNLVSLNPRPFIQLRI